MVSYTYDTAGARTSKTVDGLTTTYRYVGGVLHSETTGNNTIEYLYDAGGTAYGFLYNGTPYYYDIDLRGDVLGIYDASGTRLVSYDYNAWGVLRSITDTSANGIGTINPIRYRGYYYDAETEFYYLQTRYYDPDLCRFINADAPENLGASGTLLGYSPFAYCENNPVMFTDPCGTCIHYPNIPAFDCISCQMAAFGAGYYTTYTPKSDGSYLVSTLIIARLGDPFQYMISKEGIIRFSFSKNNYFWLHRIHGEELLAKSMISAAKSINYTYLEGRTVKGLAFELKVHYRGYRMTGIGRFETADMGSANPTSNGYDSNAFYFEMFS